MHASVEAEDGRYFKKTLDQLDQVSFVRDRTGDLGDTAEEAEEGISEAEPEEDYASDAVPESPSIPPTKSQQQLDIEREWDLPQPGPTNQRRSSGDESDDESIGSRRSREALSDEDVCSGHLIQAVLCSLQAANDSHDSEPEDSRLLPLRKQPGEVCLDECRGQC